MPDWKCLVLQESPRPETLFIKVETKEEMSIVDVAPGIETNYSIEEEYEQHVHDGQDLTVRYNTVLSLILINTLMHICLCLGQPRGF